MNSLYYLIIYFSLIIYTIGYLHTRNRRCHFYKSKILSHTLISFDKYSER